MATPMDTHLNLFVDASSEIVDVTLYRQVIGSLMYLMNTMPDICFVVNTLSQYLFDPRNFHFVDAKHMSGLVFVRYINDPMIYLY